jgi:hypothetical protein
MSMMRDNRGMTILEVAVSGAILAVILLGIANFSAFTAKMNQSNNQSDNFAGIMSTINNIIKTQECDTLLGGIPAPTTSGSVAPFVGFAPVPGFMMMSPSPAPSGFAFGTGTDPTSFQLTFIRNMDTATIVSPATTWYLNTYDLRIALKKVDSSGHPMAGNPVQMKDYLVNLWVDTTGTTILPQGTYPNQYGTCTYKKPVVFSGPVVTPACVTYPGSFSVQWSMPAADTASLWFSTDWGLISPLAPALAQGQMSYTPLPAPNGNFNDLTVAMTVSDPGGNVSPSSTSSPAVSVYQSPTVSASFNPVTISSPAATLPLYVTTNAFAAGGGASIVSPFTQAGLTNGTNSVAVNITVPGPYSFTVVATNGCGATAQSIATVTYSATGTCSCSSVPTPCPSGTTYSNGCGGSCSCPTGACTGCPATSTYCASAVPPTDSCGNPCGLGTEASSCPPPTSCIAPSTADSCGNAGACPCTGSGSSPSPGPSPSPSGPTWSCNCPVISGTAQCSYTNISGTSCPGVGTYACVQCSTPQTCQPANYTNLNYPMTCSDCGSSFGGSFSSAPTTGLCTEGTTPTVTNSSGVWTWSCPLNSCEATNTAPSPSPSPSASCLPDGTVIAETVLVPACPAPPATDFQCTCVPINFSSPPVPACCTTQTNLHNYTLGDGCVAQTYDVCGP